MNQCYIAYQPDDAHDNEHIVVKIGFSKNPGFRFMELQAMSWRGPKWIEATTQNTKALGSEIERFLHDALSEFRIHHEWFHVPRPTLEQAKSDVWRRFGESFVFYDVSAIDEAESARDVLARRVGA